MVPRSTLVALPHVVVQMSRRVLTTSAMVRFETCMYVRLTLLSHLIHVLSLSSLLPFFFLLSTLRIVTTPLTTKALVPHVSSRSVAAKNDTVASQVGCWLGGTQGTNLDQVSTNVAAAQENPGNSLGRGVPDATPE
jgi:hypothetical protein